MLNRFVAGLDEFLDCWTEFRLIFLGSEEEKETHMSWVGSYGRIGLGVELFERAGNGFFFGKKKEEKIV